MPLQPDEEHRIAELLKGGNVRAAAAALYRAYSSEIFRFLWHRFDEEADAEDACAECFANIFQALPEFRFEASFRTWAYRIARNAASYRRRTDGRWRERFVHDASTAAEMVAAAARRESTAAYKLTRNKDALRGMRAEVVKEPLVHDIFALLECRMSWDEITAICSAQTGGVVDGDELSLLKNRLQQKYTRAVRKLEAEFKLRKLVY